jgi:cytochrome c peroxidase
VTQTAVPYLLAPAVASQAFLRGSNMSRPSLTAFVCTPALLVAACGGSSSGGGDEPGNLEVEALRRELFLAGIQPLPEPPPVSDEMFELGRALFFDKILSGNEDVSCATCHLPQFGTGDGRTLSDGVHGIGFGPERGGGTLIPRNSPPLFMLHLKSDLFWDGRVQAREGVVSLPPAVPMTDAMRAIFRPGLEVLAAQAMLPPVSREEMRGEPGENPIGDLGDGYNSRGGTPDSTTAVWDTLAQRLLGFQGYMRLFRDAYPPPDLGDFSFAHVGNAIAAFEARAFSPTDSAFERFVRGDDSALTARQVAGALEFFGPAGCARCHSGALFSDQDYHNTGLPQLGPGVGGGPSGTALARSDIGRENVTGDPADRFRFRTPTLLNVELTAPYGHAGQFATLRDMVAHYRDAELSLRLYDIQSNVFDAALVTTQVSNADLVLAMLDPHLHAPRDFDVDAVVEFLRSLTAWSAAHPRDLVPESVPSGLPVF